MKPLAMGEVTMSRVVEIDRSFYPTASMLPDSTPEAIARHRDWLAPFVDERTGDLGSRIGAWILMTPSSTVLVDTGVGNGKRRERTPLWHMRQGAFLDDLALAGVTPDTVDYVVCTHLHVDHVGWNTHLVGGKWRPTFPRARYVIAGPEWEFWRHEHAMGRDEGCLEDSVMPVAEAGVMDVVEATHEIDPWIRLEPSTGHTPGHVSVRVTTSAGQAVLVGDLMHRPVQVAEPHWSSRFCADGKHAARTRQAFIERHADTGVLVMPAHFPRPGYIVGNNGGYRFVPAV